MASPRRPRRRWPTTRSCRRTRSSAGRAAGLARRRRGRASRRGTSDAPSSMRARTGVIAGRADDLGRGDEGADPVRDVDDVLARDAGEEVLVAAGDADDLVRQHRPDDERDVVLDDRPVEQHGDVHRQPTLGQLASRAAGIGAEVGEGRRVPPLVVDDGHPRIGLLEPPTRRSRGAGASASSLIGWCVPSAMSVVIRVTRPCSARVHRARSTTAAGRCGCRRGRGCRRSCRRGRRRAELLGDERRHLSGVRTPCSSPIGRRAGPTGSAGSRSMQARLRHAITLAAGLTAPARRSRQLVATRATPLGGRRTHDCACPTSPSAPATGSCPADPATRGHRPPPVRRRCATCRSSPRTATCRREWLASDIPFTDPTSLLLSPDHYVFRLLHAQGVPLADLGVGEAAARRRRGRAGLAAVLRALGRCSAGRRAGSGWRASWRRLRRDRAPVRARPPTRSTTPSRGAGHAASSGRARWPSASASPCSRRPTTRCDDLEHHRGPAPPTRPSRTASCPTFRPDRYLEPAPADFAELVKAARSRGRRRHRDLRRLPRARSRTGAALLQGARCASRPTTATPTS